MRDNSLGDLRAATNRLKQVRDWDQEEYGLVAAVLTVVLSICWFYGTYVADKPEVAKKVPETELEICLDRNYGADKRVCKFKYGGALGQATLGLFPL